MQAKGSRTDTIMLIEKPFILYLIWKMDKIVKESNSIILNIALMKSVPLGMDSELSIYK